MALSQVSDVSHTQEANEDADGAEESSGINGPLLPIASQKGKNPVLNNLLQVSGLISFHVFVVSTHMAGSWWDVHVWATGRTPRPVQSKGP